MKYKNFLYCSWLQESKFFFFFFCILSHFYSWGRCVLWAASIELGIELPPLKILFPTSRSWCCPTTSVLVFLSFLSQRNKMIVKFDLLFSKFSKRNVRVETSLIRFENSSRGNFKFYQRTHLSPSSMASLPPSLPTYLSPSSMASLSLAYSKSFISMWYSLSRSCSEDIFLSRSLLMLIFSSERLSSLSCIFRSISVNSRSWPSTCLCFLSVSLQPQVDHPHHLYVSLFHCSVSL